MQNIEYICGEGVFGVGNKTTHLLGRCAGMLLLNSNFNILFIVKHYAKIKRCRDIFMNEIEDLLSATSVNAKQILKENLKHRITLNNNSRITFAPLSSFLCNTRGVSIKALALDININDRKDILAEYIEHIMLLKNLGAQILITVDDR